MQSALSKAATPGKVPQFVLSFSATPTFFLTLHLQSLMENSFAGVNVESPALFSPEISEHGERSAPECAQFNPSSVAVSDIVNKDVSSSAFKEFQGIAVEIPSPDQVDMSFDGKGRISRQVSSDMSWNAKEVLFHSPKSTGRRSSLKRGRSSSISSPLENLSPVWTDGPKRPRTHVRYTLPSAGYEFKGKQKTQNPKDVPCKRIRRASLKRSNEKNFELLACSANVLITHEDKGWRECGANIVLEAADHNEWKLAVKLSGLTKYSYKVKHMLQAGSTNRYTHSMLWKGGKDWVLEFPDRSWWMLFKEMHEECYNRNVRAASVKHIPIPGVKLIEESDESETEIPFVRNSIKYFRQVQTDVEMAIDPSHVLYDIDSDDEQWLMANKNYKRVGISDELLEKTIDMFEKVSYVQRRDSFSDDEIQELVIGVRSVEAAKAIYEYWREKREKMGVPLIRHLQPPLWERYQHQLKEWERTLAQGYSVGNQEKFPPEKPPMFAFCLKPRGLDVPNKGSKQRSHRKFSVNGHHDSHLAFGRRSNGHAFVDEKVLYTNTVHESSDASPSLQASSRAFSPRDAHITLGKPVFYRNKSRKVQPYPSSHNQKPTMNRKGVQTDLPELPNQNFLDGPHMQGAVQLNNLDLQELQARDASRAAQHARNIAKLKREKAQKLLCKADLAIHKAVNALMTAEAIKAAHGNSNGNKNIRDDPSALSSRALCISVDHRRDSLGGCLCVICGVKDGFAFENHHGAMKGNYEYI
ncbi:hypothetical protein BUALT_Bualt05G0018000 [Buddleja alternifolia]|uniref:Enhancer of polycomb-like protein n=1 Tax=Buddleja alternifolia TaxID=168488 RepID=A0AAV6XPB2_9LAMI|nr:hypothetical protein BUALT_Bualt05G0018000 [Buddleja alternifolia]